MTSEDAIDNARLEGYEPEQDMLDLLQAVLDGTMSPEEAIEQVKNAT